MSLNQDAAVLAKYLPAMQVLPPLHEELLLHPLTLLDRAQLLLPPQPPLLKI
ncbi:MAG: hypothetical protein RJB29_476 [Actinomycetota bacterium]